MEQNLRTAAHGTAAAALIAGAHVADAQELFDKAANEAQRIAEQRDALNDEATELRRRAKELDAPLDTAIAHRNLAAVNLNNAKRIAAAEEAAYQATRPKDTLTPELLDNADKLDGGRVLLASELGWPTDTALWPKTLKQSNHPGVMDAVRITDEAVLYATPRLQFVLLVVDDAPRRS